MQRLFRHPTAYLVGLLCLALALVGCAGQSGSPPSGNPAAGSSQAVASSPAALTISPVQEFPDLGTTHLPDGEVYTQYNSNPPTSGPHAPRFLPRWGVYDQAVPKEMLVHNMEHGGVIVWFNCQTPRNPLPEAECNRLSQQIAGVVQPLVQQNKNVIVSPFPEMEHRIAMTAWTRLQTMDQFNEQAIRAFIERYDRAYNPENF
jgi:hypothetical protein